MTDIERYNYLLAKFNRLYSIYAPYRMYHKFENELKQLKILSAKLHL